MKTLQFSRTIDAPKSATWEIVSDAGNYSRYAPNIDHSRITSGEGEGMLRECSNKNGKWKEICTQWDDESGYAFEVQTQEKDYPYPFKLLRGHWAVKHVGENRSLIEMTFNYQFSNKLVAVLIEPLIKYQFYKVCVRLLDNWECAIRNGEISKPRN